jgi:PEP-CTERM motif
VIVVLSEGYQLKLTKLFLITALGAGSLQASIIYNQATGLGLSAGPNSIISNLSLGSTANFTQLAAANTPTTQYTGFSLVANTALYYDPNGGTNGNNCSMGSGGAGSATVTNPVLTACVGNYNLSAGGGATPQTIQPTLLPTLSPGLGVGVYPDLDVDFTNPVFASSLLFSAPGQAGQGSLTFEVNIFSAAHVLIDTMSFKATLKSPAYLVITESQAFSVIDIQQLTNSNSTGVGATGEGSTGQSFNALIGDLQATTQAPEPGTIGLLSLGLAGIGYFARRRKA